MHQKYFHIIQNFNPAKDYGITINSRHKKVLSLLKKNHKFALGDFIEKNLEILGNPDSPLKQRKDIFYQAFCIAKQIGLAREATDYPIQFRDFTRLETVQYFYQQLRANKRKFTKSDIENLSPTQKSYLYALWNFNNWLCGKEFESTVLIQSDLDTFKKIRSKTILEGLEHFLNLFGKSQDSMPDFIKMTKRYLYDKEKHGHKKARTMRQVRCAIESYFEKNDTPLIFKFDEKARYPSNSSEDEQPQLSLEDLMKMLTLGKPTITQKAVILCKFHRGLDTSTLVDRFNFQAWQQLEQYFGTDDHTKWDMEKCPVPITLTRIKTDYTHLGFLDIDAIEALKEYLDYRFKKTGKKMSMDEPLFLNPKNQILSDFWVRHSFNRLAKTAGIQSKLKREGIMPRYKKDSHELRDLLKSTLIECGTRMDIADHVIGHKPKDSYEKQSLLYPETLREEYGKASPKINIFSNLFSNLQKTPNVQKLQNEIKELQEIVKRLEQKDTIRNNLIPVELKSNSILI